MIEVRRLTWEKDQQKQIMNIKTADRDKNMTIISRHMNLPMLPTIFIKIKMPTTIVLNKTINHSNIILKITTTKQISKGFNNLFHNKITNQRISIKVTINDNKDILKVSNKVISNILIHTVNINSTITLLRKDSNQIRIFKQRNHCKIYNNL